MCPTRRRARSKEEEYQELSIARVHREDETVTYPKNVIPVRLNPMYCGDADNPTRPRRSSSSVDMEPPWSVYRTGVGSVHTEYVRSREDVIFIQTLIIFHIPITSSVFLA